MLSLLHIENIAVIEQADLRFDRGFNVLTGETGAGKSIVIDAIRAKAGHKLSSHAFPSLYVWQKEMKLLLYLQEDFFL